MQLVEFRRLNYSVSSNLGYRQMHTAQAAAASTHLRIGARGIFFQGRTNDESTRRTETGWGSGGGGAVRSPHQL